MLFHGIFILRLFRFSGCFSYKNSMTPAFRLFDVRRCNFHYQSDGDNDNYNENPFDDDDDKYFDPLISDPDHAEMMRTFFPVPGAGHRVFIIQPRLTASYGKVDHYNWKRMRSMANIKLQIDEAVALAETNNNWKIVAKATATTSSTNRKQVFGDGNLESLKIEVDCEKAHLSAIFINIERLRGSQQIFLQSYFGLPIMDRYAVVLNIFKEHARTKVAKLQVALAEVPYLRSRLLYDEKPTSGKMAGGTRYIGGSGETYLELHRRLLDERQVKLKNALKKLSTQREVFRRQRGKKEMPIIAVVGYTNSGKTSLIKALTGDKDMQPVNHLFATLDVTVHGGFLPNRMPVMYVDTVGFITDIPTMLIASFASTLEDAVQADIIVHVRDVSHPDTEHQRLTVLETLQRIRVPEKAMKNMIEVGNKIDLLPPKDDDDNKESDSINEETDYLPISATMGKGLEDLRYKLEELVLTTTERETTIFRVPNGGEEYRWLHKEGAIKSIEVDTNDAQYLIMEVILPNSVLGKFRHLFGNLQMHDKGIAEN